MVTRCVVGGFVPRLSLLLAMFVLPVALAAQTPSASPSPSSLLESAPPVAKPAASAPQNPASSLQGNSSLQSNAPQQAAAPVYGKIVVESAPLRCWSSAVATPPAYEDTLKKDQIVRLGRSENGFREVILPLGPLGYVSKRFTQESEDGTVTTKGTKVAFRYRPRTSEAPVAQMVDGTTMHVISLEEDWYTARVPGIEAWVAEAEVQVVPSDPEVVAASDALAAEMQAGVQARLNAIAAEQKQQEQDRIDLEAVKVVDVAFQKELQKPVEEQDFKPLQEALAKVSADIAEDGVARTACAELEKRLKAQQWIVDAIHFQNRPQPVVEAAAKPVATDRLQRFDSIGWLRYESRLAGPGVYYIEKGGRRQHLLSCNTGRFDLSLYVGREVGVIGPRRSPIAETLSVVDVERIEVLGTARN